MSNFYNLRQNDVDIVDKTMPIKNWMQKCMMINRTGDHLSWMNVWGMHLKRRLDKPVNIGHYPCIYYKFH